MIYRPIVTRQLWDTWMFPWEGRYHLFHSETHEWLWDHVGHAVSDDLVHWETRPSIPTRGPAGAWNHGPMLTGTIVHRDGTFSMVLGAEYQGVQMSGVYTSTDLDNWSLHPAGAVLRPAGPHYLSQPAGGEFPSADWRDPCIVYRPDDGYYHAYLCARCPVWSAEDNGAAIGHARSKDLFHWEHLPPVARLGNTFWHTEVPDAFELDGRNYMLFSTISRGGIDIRTSGRDHVSGTFYLIGEGPDGPFHLPDDFMLIGNGGHFANYVGRTCEHPGGLLLCHHTNAERPVFAAPKIISARADGTLSLRYFPALEKIETIVVVESIGQAEDSRPIGDLAIDFARWDRSDDGLVGFIGVGGTARTVARELGDVHVECKVVPGSADKVGLVLRSRKHEGLAVMLDIANQAAVLTAVSRIPRAGWGKDLSVRVGSTRGRDVFDEVRRELPADKEYHLRCFARDEHFEVYLDDEWLMTGVFPGASKAGDVELLVERGQARFTALRIAEIEPLA